MRDVLIQADAFGFGAPRQARMQAAWHAHHKLAAVRFNALQAGRLGNGAFCGFGRLQPGFNSVLRFG